jgi:hypothetical protein
VVSGSDSRLPVGRAPRSPKEPDGALSALESEQRGVDCVGRLEEVSLVRRALLERRTAIFHVHGPGGVGKTSLLHAFAAEARRHSVAPVWIDARDLEPTLPAVLAALANAKFPAPEAAADGVQRMLLIDTYELLRAIDPDLCRELLRRVAGPTLLVIAGRSAPGVEWRGLSLWGSAIVPIALRNFSPAEAELYLERHNVRGEVARAIVQFSHGHPLALALTADAWRSAPDLPFTPAAAPATLATLYDYFVRGVADSERRAALEIAALLHTTTEATLAAVFDGDARSAFAWLRELSFMVVGSRGVFPHDLAREVILAELRWRNPERLAALALRCQHHYTALMKARSGTDLAQTFSDFSFVVGHNPRLRMMLTDSETNLTSGPLRSSDVPAILDAVQRHEGPTSVVHVQHWLTHQPAAFRVVRGESGEVAAFLAQVRLDLTTAAERGGDPLTVAAWDYAVQLMGEVPRGPMTYTRFIMACDTYQDHSLALATCWRVGAMVLFLPDFVMAIARFHEGRKWADLVTFTGSRFVPELAHELDGRKHEVTVRDHRGISPADWLASMNERTDVGDWREPATAAPPPVSALSRESFETSVRQALRHLSDPILLAGNPLVESLAVRTLAPKGASAKERAACLNRLLTSQIDALRGTPRGNAQHRVIFAAYVSPAGKHERAARDLGISYSTFRRLLAAATHHLVAALWERDGR